MAFLYSGVTACAPDAATPHNTTDVTSSGCIAAYSAQRPESLTPNRLVRSRSAPRMTACTSSICCSSVGALSTGSDSPVPRRSNITNRANDAIRCRYRAVTGSSHMSSTWDAGPGAYTKFTGPSPTTW